MGISKYTDPAAQNRTQDDAMDTGCWMLDARSESSIKYPSNIQKLTVHLK